MDTDWAFISQNMGPSLYKDFSLEGVFVIDGQGKTRYSVINGQLVNTDLQRWLHKDITPLIDIARQQAGKPYSQNHILKTICSKQSSQNNRLKNATEQQHIAVDTLDVAGQPALIAAAALTPGEDPRVQWVAGPPSVLVFINILTPAELNALGRIMVSTTCVCREIARMPHPNLRWSSPHQITVP